VLRERSWTVYIAQDKHLDYDWCGTESEIETRMAGLMDGYLDLVEEDRSRWNLDCTLWVEAYRRQRGDAGVERLLNAIRDGRIGYGAQYNVMLWGLMGPELAIRALAGGRDIEEAAGRPAHTALIMENAGMPWGVAQVLADCGIRHVARGIYDLRGESYVPQRAPYPLFWWIAPDGSRLLTHWPPYHSTRTWGGYAEAGELLRLAGEDWDAFHMQRVGERNTPDVYAARVAYIDATVARYETLGEVYPVSSILLLGTGWDNWTITDDVSRFIERYNAEQDGRIRLVDARYDEFFAVVEHEIAERGLILPELRGSFGICWEEWAAHLAGYYAEFRRAERLLPRIEASLALAAALQSEERREPTSSAEQRLYGDIDQTLDTAYRALLRFAEHDMGGCRLANAAIAAGNRAAATARALTIAHTLAAPAQVADTLTSGERVSPWRCTDEASSPVELSWRGGLVVLDPQRGAVTALRDNGGVEWMSSDAGLGLGEMVLTHYAGEGPFREVLPTPLPGDPHPLAEAVLQREAPEAIEVRIQGRRWGIEYEALWRFHHQADIIDVTYRLCGGWDAVPQSLQIAFPLALNAGPEQPIRYHHDSVGAIVAVGRAQEGGEELPGANPVLRALHTFAAAHETPSLEPTYAPPRGAVLLSPDAHLVLFGQAPALDIGPASAGITSMPLVNLTRNDLQLVQGGRDAWTFRYRLILERAPFDALRALHHAQGFAESPFPWLAGIGPSLPGLQELEIDYSAGPLLSCRAMREGDGLLLRFWNVLDQPAEGTLLLPEGYCSAERCDALDRRLAPLALDGRRARFDVRPRGLVTIALRR
jgi:hypothetical protein